MSPVEPKPTPQSDYDRIRLTAIHLKEQGQFDTVHIFALKKSEGLKTIAHNVGEGDFYARFGQIREWLIQEEEVSKDRVRSKDYGS